MRLTRDRAGVRLVLGGGAVPPGPGPNPVLVKALVRAHSWWARLGSGEARSIRELARAEKLAERYVTRLLPLAFLAPDVVEAILDGRHPADLTLEALHDDLPLAWAEQRQRLCLAAASPPTQPHWQRQTAPDHLRIASPPTSP